MVKAIAYYVVWSGKKPGIYDSVTEFQEQIYQFKGAKYKKFKTLEEAEKAFREHSENTLVQESVAEDLGQHTLTPKKISMPEHWEDYLACILIHMVLPLLPILIEYILSHSIKVDSVTLTAAMYAITIGISSKSKSQFALGIIISLIFAICYGSNVHDSVTESYQVTEDPIIIKAMAYCSIAAIFILHGVERFNRHIVDRVSFFNFK